MTRHNSTHLRAAMVLLSVLLAALIAMCAGCSDTDKSDTSQDGAFTVADVALVYDTLTVRPGDRAETLISALGDGYSYEEALSCHYAANGQNGEEGKDKYYTYPDSLIATAPLHNDGDYIMSIDAYGGDWQTAGGIKPGDALSEIERVYGAGYSDEGNMLIYYSDPTDPDSERLYFLMENGLVSCVGFA